MSLLDKASLVITPNAVKAGKLYSVVPNTTLGDMDVVRGTTATRVNSAGLIESVAVNIPRIDYTNVSCPTLLVEPLRTNLALNSGGNLSTYPTSVNVSNASSSFNSFVNAIQFPSTGLALAYKTVITTVQTYAISAFIKMDDNSVPILSASATTGNLCLIIAGNIATNNLKVESYGNNVYRLSATATSAGINGNNGVLRYDTQVLKSFKITGIQLEAASYPTSYIPTVASIQSRNADVISKTGISSLIGQTEGTIYAEIKVNKLIGIASRYIFHISDGTINNRIYMAFSGASSNVLRGRIFNGGTLQCSIDTSTITTTGTYKLALAYKNNDIVFYVNGVQIGVDTSATIPTCSRVDVGQNYAGVSQLSDNVLLSTLFKTRLTNGELVTLTTL